MSLMIVPGCWMVVEIPVSLLFFFSLALPGYTQSRAWLGLLHCKIQTPNSPLTLAGKLNTADGGEREGFAICGGEVGRQWTGVDGCAG